MSSLHPPLEPDKVYHIWTHANGKDNLFRNKENYRYFLYKYKENIHPIVETFAYCLMPNHLHLMVRINNEMEVFRFLQKKKSNLKDFDDLGGFATAISHQFSNLFNGYTQAYNKMHNRKGSLFTPNFPRKAIEDETYFTAVIAYIHNNPVYHGFSEKIKDWPHSSWHAYLSDKPTNISREEVLEWFGGKEAFIDFHQAFLNERWEKLLER